ncbi:MAG: bifunctional diguanylate cyclase/phosphodiesterase [Methylobacteriaceae bacterium]|nr:bifunctional diguanylate cyclase/phosphodiesterase [Methylobacteriaceae bacterium]
MLSALLNTLFLASDWRFHGTPHFLPAVTARVFVVILSLACVVWLRRAHSFPRLQRTLFTWELGTALAVGELVSSRSDIALMVVLMLPAIYALVVPTAFTLTALATAVCSGVLLAGYMLPPPLPPTALGLGLASVIANTALLLVVVRANRLRRLEWLATRAERDAKEALAASIRRREEAEAQVRALALHDALTALPNRYQFQERLELALRAGRPLRLALIDLDDFKHVNDMLGHDAGDELLKEGARRLAGVAARWDVFVARLGGDEFVLLDDRAAEPSRPANDDRDDLVGAVQHALEEPVTIAGRDLSLCGSIGVADAPQDGRSGAELLKAADLALYAAKEAGRARAFRFEPSMRDALERRLTILEELRRGLPEGEIVPFYQPKVDLRTGEIIGFEALARWQHPTAGLLTPARFQEGIEDHRIGLALGDAMLAAVARDLAGWLDAAGMPAPGRIAVNLSNAQLADPDLTDRLLHLIRAEGLGPERFTLELTETVLIGRHGERVVLRLEELREAGFRLALDDFGTGFASLTHLRRLPVHEVKIDRSFVADVGRGGDAEAIVHAILDLSRRLRLRVTAEGVEDAQQAAWLRAFDCAEAQGYLFGRPIPAARVPWLLRSRLPPDARVSA